MVNGSEVTDATLFEAKYIPPSPAFEKLLTLYPHIVNDLNELEKKITTFQEDINSLEKSGILHGVSLKLAKHEGDVKGLFLSLRGYAHKLKKIKARPMNASEKRIADNLFSRLISSLSDNVGPFRACCSALTDFFPDGVLEKTRAVVDAEGVKNTLIVVRQLGIESMFFDELKDITVSLSDLTKQLHEKISELMKVSEAEQFVDDVMEKVDKFVKLSMKTSPMIIKYKGRENWKECVVCVECNVLVHIHTTEEEDDVGGDWEHQTADQQCVEEWMRVH
eukprot:m.118400 g.118400  ORF g.118400 m.118400 type:complete len:278 (-) comp12892_c2_seq7:332-1165(-)